MHKITKDKKVRNAITPFFDASGPKNICATISIGREIWCLPCAGFFLSLNWSEFTEWPDLPFTQGTCLKDIHKL
jgi:hypothetical protein